MLVERVDGEEEMEDLMQVNYQKQSRGADLFCLSYRVFAGSQVWEGRAQSGRVELSNSCRVEVSGGLDHNLGLA